MSLHDADAYMTRALALAKLGQGWVEPNPMVGAVVVQDGGIVGEGYHQKYGGPHAEVNALTAAGEQARGATLYVTLEPCCHQGKTPPCTKAIIQAGIREVIAAGPDPYAEVSGNGFDELRQAGINVTTGFYREAAEQLNAPYFKLVRTGMPYVITKWAMTLDGKIATSTGDSQWISNEKSRAEVHALRGRVDAIITGIGTVVQDDPLLTARPAGSRVAARIVLDSKLRISLDSQLVKTAREAPVCIVHRSRDGSRIKPLQEAGCECLFMEESDKWQRVLDLLKWLGNRRFTNVLFEAGPQVLGSCFDARVVDEVWTFVSPKLLGSGHARGPLEGTGVMSMNQAWALHHVEIERFDNDVLIRGRC